MEKQKFKIEGMTCTSCETLIEDEWLKIPGVHKIFINHRTGYSEITAERPLSLEELTNALGNYPYKVLAYGQPTQSTQAPSDQAKLHEAGAIFLIVIAVYFLLNKMNLIPNLGVSDSMSYGFVFVLGLVASASTCIAVTGGLLVSLAAKHNEKHPEHTPAQKLQPHLFFNIGRLAGYTAFGGIVGYIGSALKISPSVNGIIITLASVIMIILGLQMLEIKTPLHGLLPKTPKFFARRLQQLSKHEKGTPFIMGALSFFLPCGFTQSLQLYVLSLGNWQAGALTMFVFALGTLPALFSLGLLSSALKGPGLKKFTKYAGAVVVLLGLLNIKNGTALLKTSLASENQGQAEVTVSTASATDAPTGEQPIIYKSIGKKTTPTDNTETPAQPTDAAPSTDVQVANMKVNFLEYEPAVFTIKKNQPVEWRIDGREAAGCAQILYVPSLGIDKRMSKTDLTVIKFTPKKAGNIEFSCPMGMTTPGAKFIVTD